MRRKNRLPLTCSIRRLREAKRGDRGSDDAGYLDDGHPDRRNRRRCSRDLIGRNDARDERTHGQIRRLGRRRDLKAAAEAGARGPVDHVGDQSHLRLRDPGFGHRRRRDAVGSPRAERGATPTPRPAMRPRQFFAEIIRKASPRPAKVSPNSHSCRRLLCGGNLGGRRGFLIRGPWSGRGEWSAANSLH
jgi:hypothetical protein